jgi:Chaperone of endosialidase
MKTTMNIINAALAVLALVWFGLSSTARAITPSPDGGYADSNTAEGTNALFNFTGVFPNNGPENTAIGFEALYHNTTGDHNTAVGAGALFSNTAGAGNTALGHDTLNRNTGSHNTATGGGALTSNTSGHDNSASGRHALTLNNSGSYNTADGEYALASSTSASQNIALGYGAGFRLTTGGNNIDIGNLGSVATEANSIRIGNPVTVVYPDGVTHAAQTKTYIAGLTTAVTGSTVVVNATTHQVGMMPSSARFKEEIKPMNEASEAILALKPVTFRYKKDIDPDRTQQYGLVAEEVEKVNPNLVVDDKEGKPYSVRYDQVNAMLLNEFLKEHKAFIAAQDKVDKLEATVATLVATVKEQAAQIQKVSAQIELSKAAPQTVKNTD